MIPKQDKPAAIDSIVRVACPSCGSQGAIRWDKLGHLHICRRCSRSFRVDPKGGLVEVVRTKDRKWVDKETHAPTSGLSRAVHILTSRVAPALGVVAAVLLALRLFSGSAPAQAHELPVELEARAQLFTKAWLKKDWALMRLLVRPGEDRQLYKWSVRQAPPVLPMLQAQPDNEPPVEVTVVSSQAQTSTLRIRIRGLQENQAAAVEMLEIWEERNRSWFFAVPAR